MKIEKLILGELEENCYILTKGNNCLIIDPGDEFEKIKEKIGTKKVVGCLITHFHDDHIGALEKVKKYYKVKVNETKYEDFDFETIDTKGHTNDSKSYYFKENKVMFVGDFLFKSSFGRTDLGGSNEDMKKSLETISQYDDDITIYPGHGPKTTLGAEKTNFAYYVRYYL